MKALATTRKMRPRLRSRNGSMLVVLRGNGELLCLELGDDEGRKFEKVVCKSREREEKIGKREIRRGRDLDRDLQ